MKRAAAASAALVLMLLAVLTIPVSAFSTRTEVVIPVTTAWAKNSDRPAKESSVVSEFTLTPLDGAPAPASGLVRVNGAGKGEFGPIAYELPGDYYYRLDGKLDNQKESVSMTVRVSVINNKDGGLDSVVTAYDTASKAEQGVEKQDTVFELTFKLPSGTNTNNQTKGKPVNTGANSDLKVWLLLAIAAIMLTIGFRRLSAEK